MASITSCPVVTLAAVLMKYLPKPLDRDVHARSIGWDIGRSKAQMRGVVDERAAAVPACPRDSNTRQTFKILYLKIPLLLRFSFPIPTRGGRTEGVHHDPAERVVFLRVVPIGLQPLHEAKEEVDRHSRAHDSDEDPRP